MERDFGTQPERPGRFKGLLGNIVTGIRRVRTDRKIHTLLERRPEGTSSLTQGEEILNIYKSVDSLSLTLCHSDEGVSKRFEFDATGNRSRGFTITYARLQEFDPNRISSNNAVQERVYASNGTTEQNTLPFSAVLDELNVANRFAAMREPG